jgi:microcystin-dependent protein
MTVSSTATKISYAGNGSTTVWSFPFAAANVGQIIVITTDALGHINFETLGSFTVTLNAPIDPNPTSVGGSVVFPVSAPPLAVGNTITIARVVQETQPVSISNQSVVYPPVVETTFDRLAMIDQQLSDQISRAFVVPVSDPPPTTLPSAAQRANLPAIFDSAGNLTAGGGVIGVVISAPMIPVVTATSLPLARTAMGVPPIDSPAFTGSPTAPTPAPGDNDTSLATTAYVQAALAAVGAAFTTGDLKPTHKVVADTGWILWIDSTIGGVGSNAGIRQNADTQALFTLYYNNYSDAVCPLLTSANAATTRAAQGTAAAAFANHCQVFLPKGSQRAIGLAGSTSTGGLSARSLGSIAGVETITQSTAQMPVHNHAAATTGPHSHGHSWTNPDVGQPVGQSGAPPINWEAAPVSPASPAALAGTDLVIATADVGISVGVAGGGAAMNIMNPMTYINIMVRL